MLLTIEEDKDRDKKRERYKDKTKKTKTITDEISDCAAVPTLLVGNAAQKSFTKTKIRDKSAPVLLFFAMANKTGPSQALDIKPSVENMPVVPQQ